MLRDFIHRLAQEVDKCRILQGVVLDYLNAVFHSVNKHGDSIFSYIDKLKSEIFKHRFLNDTVVQSSAFEYSSYLDVLPSGC